MNTKQSDYGRNDSSSPPKRSWWRRFVAWGSSKTFTDWCIVVFTAVLAGSSIYQFTIMRGQLTQMQETRASENRSWVRIRVNDPAVEKSIEEIKELTYTKKMENVGKSPASKIYIWSAVDVLAANDAPKFTYGGRSTVVTLGSMFPGDIQSFDMGWFRPNGTLAQLTAQERQNFRSGNSYAVAYGIIAYTDEFGPHWTQFCEWSHFAVGDFQARACTDYNQYGDGQGGYEAIASHAGR